MCSCAVGTTNWLIQTLALVLKHHSSCHRDEGAHTLLNTKTIVGLTNTMGEKTSEEKQYNEFMMNTYSMRLLSFVDWPFTEGCACTPAKMSAAGFYHCPTDHEPDAVKCFMCFKELDGWEPDDNPMSEHKRHSPNCAFVNLKKDFEDMTMEEFLKLEGVRQQNKLMKVAETATKEFKHQATKTREQLELLTMNL